jgi:Na+/melibiose symporter-like transporter
MATRLANPFSLFCYSAFALPLALSALPVYVYTPALYAEREHLPLALLGAALLAARLFDALIDPVLGRWIDQTRSSGYGRHIALAVPLLGAGFTALFNPPQLGPGQALVWLLAALLVVHTGYSLAGIAYQSWGAGLTQARELRSLVTACRETCGLFGVIAAAVLPAAIGLPGLCLVFLLALAASAWLLIYRGAPAASTGPTSTEQASLLLPLANPAFRRLITVFLCNGIASAIPATLFTFFARDHLGLGGNAGYFLALYFLAGAMSMPLWVMLARRHGEARVWLWSMLLALAAFCRAYTLGAGDTVSFGLICVLSGFALGADLALPPALLTAVIHHAGDGGKREGAYFGLWSWATKMTLALAAGTALPVLAWLGYTPGDATEQGGHALSIAYAVLPCVFKAAACLMLFLSRFDDT